MNTWNITEVASSIAQALNMLPEEREKRHKHNFEHVRNHTAQLWAETFVRYISCMIHSGMFGFPKSVRKEKGKKLGANFFSYLVLLWKI